MKFNINPDFDLDSAKLEYGQNKKVRLTNFIPEEQAIKLTEAIHNHAQFEQAFFLDNESRQSAYEKIQELSPEERANLIQAIYKQAAQGVGFWYGREGISDKSNEVILAFYNWYNSDEVISAIKNITGINEIKAVSGQVSRFMPGDFLTRHKDNIGQDKRRVAYSFSLSPAWHPDWGGLLQFYKEDGSPTETWVPKFNTINLFDVTEVHSVTTLAAFSPSPRYAISGWFKEIK